jgi:hypothetical protein
MEVVGDVGDGHGDLMEYSRDPLDEQSIWSVLARQFLAPNLGPLSPYFGDHKA